MVSLAYPIKRIMFCSKLTLDPISVPSLTKSDGRPFNMTMSCLVF